MGINQPREGQLDSPKYSDPAEDVALDAVSDEYLSSDDSVDTDLGAMQPTQAPDVTQKYGIGAELMAKMGYVSGSGLGQDSSGIVDPIEVERRQKRAGLGMEAAVSPPASPPQKKRSAPPPDSKIAKLQAARDELDSLQQQQDQLERALQVVSNAGYQLDVVEFYERFGDKPIWMSERLYEVVAAVVDSQIPSTDAFRWLMDHPDLLIAANTSLPVSEWGEILARKWIRPSATDLGRLLNQWLVGRHNGFAAAAQHLSSLFSDSDIVQRSVAQGPDFLKQLLRILPDSTHLVRALKRFLPSLALVDQVSVLAAIPLDSAAIAKAVVSNPETSYQTQAFAAFAQVLDRPALSEVLMRTNIREQWLEGLHSQLRGAHQSLIETQQYWRHWRPFFSLFEDEAVSQWLKAGLDAINESLDGSERFDARKPTSTENPVQPRSVMSSMKDVIEHLCYMNDWEKVSTAPKYIIRGPRREAEIIIEKDVCFIRQSQSLIPVSLDVLQSYLSKVD